VLLTQEFATHRERFAESRFSLGGSRHARA
jgi:hypothetical protein